MSQPEPPPGLPADAEPASIHRYEGWLFDQRHPMAGVLTWFAFADRRLGRARLVLVQPRVEDLLGPRFAGIFPEIDVNPEVPCERVGELATTASKWADWLAETAPERVRTRHEAQFLDDPERQR